jgi:hypothetical protein
MNAKKILVMMFILSLLVAGGVMQITAQNSTSQEPSEEEISSSTKGPDLDNVEEEFEGQDADDEGDVLEEAEEGKVAEVEDDGIVYESEGEVEEEHQD